MTFTRSENSAGNCWEDLFTCWGVSVWVPRHKKMQNAPANHKMYFW